jgi:hypothetical protein
LIGAAAEIRAKIPPMKACWFASLTAELLATAAFAGNTSRAIPQPLPAHPGNVFLADEDVRLAAPASGPAAWRLVDYDRHAVANGPATAGTVNLGRLPVGWYEVIRGEDTSTNTNRASLAVLARLKAPTPQTSPIALDVAMAWFYPPPQMPAAASLCALAGVNWVRDRLNWAEMEPARGTFASSNRYDASADAQTAAGLRQLQVIHQSPAWANAETKRFPLNLRDAYNFYRAMARRWRGQLQAFEPWNEADIRKFGGQSGMEIATLQKAAFFGMKAGNPDLIVCQNVFAIHRATTLADFAGNEAGAYFDTFNLHHYVPFDAYPKVYADFRAVSAGKPLWVTECSVPVKWTGREQLKEPSAADLRVQAERVAKVFACALHEGAAEVFYFLLPHYAEGQTQFGILRPDLTPRPAFVALAAAGRLLADARPLGRLKASAANVRAFLFAARPDGQARLVLVAWTTDGQAELPLPLRPAAVFDHLGRNQTVNETSLPLNAAPVFAVFAPAAEKRFDVEPPPAPAPKQPGKPCPIILQPVLPSRQLILDESAYRIVAGQPETIPIRLYNFSHQPAKGGLRVLAPAGWTATLPHDVALAADTDTELALIVTSGAAPDIEPLRIEGDFGRAGQAVLSVRFQPERR